MNDTKKLSLIFFSLLIKFSKVLCTLGYNTLLPVKEIVVNGGGAYFLRKTVIGKDT